MNKRFDIFTFVLVLLILSIIFLLLSFAITAMISSAADAEAQEIIEQAQERIDLYKAANTPAKERPADTVVVYEDRPVVATPEPSPEPVEDWYIESIPLDKQLQKVVFDAACENGVDYYLLLAVMQVESGYDCAAVSRCGCYGLMQLNPQYFPSGLGDEDNIGTGAAYLADLLEQYKGDEAAALRAYNHGYDDGDRGHSRAVQEAREEIAALSGQVMGP